MRQLFGVVDADACVRGGPMSIAVSLRVSDYPFSANITGNLVPMADACGLFPALWHPESLAADPTGEYALAYDLIGPLEAGLAQLHGNEYADLEPANGWGSRTVLLKAATDLLVMCRLYPNAEVIVR